MQEIVPLSSFWVPDLKLQIPVSCARPWAGHPQSLAAWAILPQKGAHARNSFKKRGVDNGLHKCSKHFLFMGWNCRCPATTIKKYSKNCGKEAIQQEIRLIQFPFGNLPNAGPRIDPVDFLCRLDLTYWTYWDAASCHVVSIYESEYPLGNKSISHQTGKGKSSTQNWLFWGDMLLQEGMD